MWLECIGLVSGCSCKEVYRYPHNNYYFFPTPLVLALFWQQHRYFYFFVHLKMFFRSLFDIRSYLHTWASASVRDASSMHARRS